MKFKENDVFILNVDIPEHNLKAGMIGAILQDIECYPQGYEVEFVDSRGYTIAQIYLLEKFMNVIKPS